jgi:hypothetical protein
MDGYHMDALARRLGQAGTRRQLVRAAMGAFGALLTVGGRASARTGCPPPYTVCIPGGCVDLQTDFSNCGECGNVCPGFQGSECCFGECVNLFDHPANCGACGVTCPPFSSCERDPAGMGTICVCFDGLTDCGGTCTDISFDVFNCGACGTVCSGYELSTTCCYGYCADLATDASNCGACGIVCGSNQVCSNYVCVTGEPTCPAGQTLCGDACADLQTSEAHCGGCFQVCDGGETCTGGDCVPPPTATEEPTPTPEPGEDTWALWQGATKLRGAVIYQRPEHSGDDPVLFSDDPAGPAYSAADFDRLAALGANYVTLVHPAVVTTSSPYRARQSSLDQLDELVAKAGDAGLYSVVAFRHGPGRRDADLAGTVVCLAGGCFAPVDNGAAGGPDLWEEAEIQSAWETAWQSAAHHFRDNPLVIGYQLMVTPDAEDAGDWEGLANRLIDVIRESDRATPILLTVSGPLDDAFDREWTDDRRTIHVAEIFAPERYLTQPADADAPLTYPGRFNSTRDEQSGAFDQEWLDALIEPMRRFEDRFERPVAIAAFGVPRWQPGAADYLDDQMSAFEDAGFNHALWAWYPSAWSDPDDAFDVLRGEDPDNHERVDSELLDVVRRHWRRNTEHAEAAIAAD